MVVSHGVSHGELYLTLFFRTHRTSQPRPKASVHLTLKFISQVCRVWPRTLSSKKWQVSWSATICDEWLIPPIDSEIGGWLIVVVPTLLLVSCFSTVTLLKNTDKSSHHLTIYSLYPFDVHTSQTINQISTLPNTTLLQQRLKSDDDQRCARRKCFCNVFVLGCCGYGPLVLSSVWDCDWCIIYMCILYSISYDTHV